MIDFLPPTPPPFPEQFLLLLDKVQVFPKSPLIICVQYLVI
jgi:hypothetical protein